MPKATIPNAGCQLESIRSALERAASTNRWRTTACNFEFPTDTFQSPDPLSLGTAAWPPFRFGWRIFPPLANDREQVIPGCPWALSKQLCTYLISIFLPCIITGALYFWFLFYLKFPGNVLVFVTKIIRWKFVQKINLTIFLILEDRRKSNK